LRFSRRVQLRSADGINDRHCDADARRCVNCNAVFPPTMNVLIDVVPGVKQSGRRGDGGRSAGVERAAYGDDCDDDDEPRSARRRATAQGGSRAATMNRVRPRSGLAAWPAYA